ncbi:MAG: tryptophan synthase alpha chain [Candidatus Poribacteria bacterium]|nr:MAG: tryptophan synthase alpha chain [Candidatus Poribacteria bacterium]
MNRVDARFEKLRADGERAFIPYFAAGDPSLSATEELVLAAAEVGADVIELGIPFSDPIADGPSIQRATERALRAGTTVEGIFRTVERIRESSDVPLVLMTYFNPVAYRGVERFCQEARQAGADGLIVPDLPVEDAEELLEAARAQELATIFLVAPTTPNERIRRIADATRGFLYAVSLTGVTGARDAISPDLQPLLERVRRQTNKPVCVGFGISNPEQARRVAQLADGVIVGSAIVNTVEAHLSEPQRLVGATREFIRELLTAVRSVRGPLR